MQIIKRQNNPSNISLDSKRDFRNLGDKLRSSINYQLLSIDCYVGYAIAEKQNSKENR